MSGFRSLLFVASSALVVGIYALILLLLFTGTMIGWTGGMGRAFTAGERIVAIFILLLSLVGLAVPIGLIRTRLRHLAPPPWLKIAAALLVIAACGLGLASLLFDPGDFFWSGAPLMVFAAGLATMTVTLRRSF